MESGRPYPPPSSASRLLRSLCKSHLLEEIEGDLLETYYVETSHLPKWRAHLFYWIQVLNFLRPFSLKRKNSKSIIMLSNHLKVAKRNLLKHKTNSLINILSLSIGIASFVSVAIYIYSELRFDRFHENAELIYRVPIDFVDDKGGRIPDATTPPALAPALKSNFPEVSQSVRLFPNWGSKFLFSTADDKRFFESGFMRTDSTFFDIFSFEFIYGNPETALHGINDIVITRSMAEKYFGEVNAIGKHIYRPDEEDHEGYKVSAIIEDVPNNSHFSFDLLARLTFDGIDENWGWYNYYTYVKVKPRTNVVAFEEKLQPFYEEQNQQEVPNIIYFQRLLDIHLHSHLKWELGTNGDITNIYIFGALAAFIMIISCLNYLNLTVSQSTRRIKEVGIRKAFGASRKTLIEQFLIETFLISGISIIVGLVLAELFLRSQSSILRAEISLLDSSNYVFLIAVTIVIIAIGLLAGAYPALGLASRKIVEAVHGRLGRRTGKSWDIKKVLLVFQFAISVFMLLATLVVYKQLSFMKASDKGLRPDQVIVIENGDAISNFQSFKNELSQQPGIASVTRSNGIIGKLNWTTALGYPEAFTMNYVVTDPDLLPTLDLKLKMGRNFSPDVLSDQEGWKMLVNETGMREMGISEENIGQSIPVIEREDSIVYGKVLGVIKDFRFTDYKLETKPFAFFYRDRPMDFIYVKMKEQNVGETLSRLEMIWSSFVGDSPLEYFFLDQTFAELVSEERRLGDIMLYLTILSIFIALVGMLAIVKMDLKDQLKAIAVRKVLGASEFSLLQLLSGRFMKLVLAANIIALPLAYLAASKWLMDFSERTTIGIGLWVIAFGGTLICVVFLVGIQALSTARTNPSQTLRQDN